MTECLRGEQHNYVDEPQYVCKRCGHTRQPNEVENPPTLGVSVQDGVKSSEKIG